MIKFTKDTDGDFSEGQIVILDHGVEDAYVMRGVAEWYTNPERMILPPKDKMIHHDGKQVQVSKK